MELEQTINETKYISYGRDPRLFQVKGNDLYYNVGTVEKPKYQILQKDYSHTAIGHS